MDDPAASRPEDFALFGSVENDDSDTGNGNVRSRRNSLASVNNEPEFTLVGTSRIGDRVSAILRNRDGTEVVVTTQSDRYTRVDGYPQYTVVEVGPGRVSLQYPTGNSCVESRNQGVSCNSAANIAELELTRGDPIPRPVVAARDDPAAPEDEGEVVVSEDQPEQPPNPFAALRARALQQNGDAPAPAPRSGRSFTPRRIDPADVPAGFRVVSTPFGDRLVRE
ncbi:MAG: hypothetical protein R3F41_09390 [Gammaproteobacteria bacterium]|nr:hypothetical protein [Pseudomonadales bacterium]MCP5347815.1 hypothetical protein [Pseudomonadales bacterium]